MAGTPDVLGVQSEVVTPSATRPLRGEYKQTGFWSTTGKVVRGKQLGRLLGFPTANLRLQNQVIPSFGVYVAVLDGMPAAASVGVRPTFGANLHPLLEVHVLGFDGNLYGRRVTVTLIERIREELRFDSIEGLITQIEQDVAVVRARSG